MFFTSKRKIGTTLVEVMVSTSCFAIVLMVLFQVVKVGSEAWRQAEAKGSTQTMMRKIEAYLLDDLRRTEASTIQRKKTDDGQTILWFKSAMGVDAAGTDSKMVFSRTSAGVPLWKRNIIYYVTPIDADWHEARFGFKCPNNNLCPHKLLIRKELCPGVAADGAFLAAETITPGAVTDYVSKCKSGESTVTYPGSLDLSGELQNPNDFKKAGCKKVLVLADCIQDFDAHFPGGTDVYEYPLSSSATPSATATPLPGIDITIHAFRYEEAAHSVGVNEQLLTSAQIAMNKGVDENGEPIGGRFIMSYKMQVIPGN